MELVYKVVQKDRFKDEKVTLVKLDNGSDEITFKKYTDSFTGMYTDHLSFEEGLKLFAITVLNKLGKGKNIGFKVDLQMKYKKMSTDEKVQFIASNIRKVVSL